MENHKSVQSNPRGQQDKTKKIKLFDRELIRELKSYEKKLKKLNKAVSKNSNEIQSIDIEFDNIKQLISMLENVPNEIENTVEEFETKLQELEGEADNQIEGLAETIQDVLRDERYWSIDEFEESVSYLKDEIKDLEVELFQIYDYINILEEAA